MTEKHFMIGLVLSGVLISYNTAAKDCRDPFTLVARRKPAGGIHVHEPVDTNEQCAINCRNAEPTCYGYDFAMRGSCFLNYKNDSSSTPVKEEHFYHHPRQFQCGSSSTGCKDPFTIVPNMWLAEADYKDYVTASDCADLCRESSKTCFSYDLEMRGDCYTYYDPVDLKENNLIEDLNVYHFQRQFECSQEDQALEQSDRCGEDDFHPLIITGLGVADCVLILCVMILSGVIASMKLNRYPASNQVDMYEHPSAIPDQKSPGYEELTPT